MAFLSFVWSYLGPFLLSYCSHANPLLSIKDCGCGNGCLSLPPSSLVLTGEKVADGFQVAGFLSSGLRNLHLEEACLLVEHRAENISFHIPSSWSEIRPHWETFHDGCLFLSQGAGRLLPDQVKVLHWYVILGVNFQPLGPLVEKKRFSRSSFF